MKRLRAFFESIVFADLKPGAVRQGQTQGKNWLGPLRGPIDRFLSGGASKDPLYLTNRSLGQKVQAWAVVAVPCLLIIGVVALALSKDYFAPPDGPAPKEMTPAEVSSKLLPNIAKDIQIDTNRDVEVVEVHVEHTAELTLTGSVRNNSARNLAAVDVVFNLTDKTGSQLGAVNTHIENLAPKSVKAFQIPISQPNAAFALVREVSIPR
jgi:hypothetical protein